MMDRKRPRLLSRLSWPAAVAIVLAWAAETSAADICFQPVVSVSTSTVRLKDIAIVSASDPVLRTRLDNIALAPAPAPGRRMRLDFAEIRSRLEASGVPASELNYSGSSVVVVASNDAAPPVKPKVNRLARPKAILPPAQIKRAEQILTEAVRRSMRAKHRDTPAMFIDVVVDPADARAVIANATQGFEVGAVDPKATEPQAVQVAYQDAQGQPARFQMQCIVAERPQVPVLTHSFSTGDVIHESDLAWKAVDSTAGLLTRPDEIVEKEAKKSLHANEPVHPDDVRNVPLVRANDIVTGIWQCGGIRITGQFKAKGDGGLGDVITIVKLIGRDQLTARVTDVHEATIVSAESEKTSSRGDEDGERAAPIVLSHRTGPHRIGSGRIANAAPATGGVSPAGAISAAAPTRAISTAAPSSVISAAAPTRAVSTAVPAGGVSAAVSSDGVTPANLVWER